MLPDSPFGEVTFPVSRAFWDGDEDGSFEGSAENQRFVLPYVVHS
jgi:hypothetical protein